MKILRRSIPALTGWGCLFFTSCTSDPNELKEWEVLEFQKPEHFPEVTYPFDKELISEMGFELGRRLFYDPILSRDGSISCNNCHIQQTAFADSPVHPVSIGIEQKLGERNSPPLMNLAFTREFFLDGGVTHLDFVPINAIESEIEMGETLRNVVLKLNRSDKYRKLFKAAYNTDSITSPYLLKSLSQFMLMMVSADAPYDRRLLKKESTEASPQEKQGEALFDTHCSSCHQGVLFTDGSYRNNGLSNTFPDTGRERITENPEDRGKFRVPSLRNVELTAPYMHNGSLKSLGEVMNHYSEGIVQSETLDPLLDFGPEPGMMLKQEQKEALIAFLKTLTDRSFITNDKFYNPL